MARRTKAQAAATREAIIEAAQRVFYARGVTNTSLAHIAKEAGVTRGAIYWHFKDKQDLFEAMSEKRQLPLEALLQQVNLDNGKTALVKLRQHFVELLKRAATDPTYRQFYEVVLLKCEFNKDHQALLKRQQAIFDTSGQRIHRILTLAQQAGDLPRALHMQKAVVYMQSSIIGLLYSWLLMPQTYDLCAHAETFVDALFDTLRVSQALQKTT